MNEIPWSISKNNIKDIKVIFENVTSMEIPGKLINDLNIDNEGSINLKIDSSDKDAIKYNGYENEDIFRLYKYDDITSIEIRYNDNTSKNLDIDYISDQYQNNYNQSSIIENNEISITIRNPLKVSGSFSFLK